MANHNPKKQKVTLLWDEEPVLDILKLPTPIVSTAIPNLPSTVVGLIILNTLHLIRPTQKRQWLNSLLRVSKDFSKILVQLKPQIHQHLKWDELLKENYESVIELVKNSSWYRCDIAIPEWLPNGTWLDGMVCKSSRKFAPVNQDTTSNLYYSLKADLSPYLQLPNQDFSDAVSSYNQFPANYFFLRKSDFIQKDQFEVNISCSQRSWSDIHDYLGHIFPAKDQQTNEEEETTEDGYFRPQTVLMSDPDYTKYFWSHFINISMNENEQKLLSIPQFQQYLNISEQSQEVIPQDIAERIDKVFARYFEKRHFYYSPNHRSNWLALHFFFGETEAFYMGFYFFGERDPDGPAPSKFFL